MRAIQYKGVTYVRAENVVDEIHPMDLAFDRWQREQDPEELAKALDVTPQDLRKTMKMPAVKRDQILQKMTDKAYKRRKTSPMGVDQLEQLKQLDRLLAASLKKRIAAKQDTKKKK
jgi:hypothetical protein